MQFTLPSFLNRSRLITTAGILLFIIIISMMFGGSEPEQQQEVAQTLPRVVVDYMQPGLRRSFTTTGEVEANQSANVIAEFKVTVTDLHVKAGDRVRVGDPIISLESQSISKRFNTAQVSYATALQSVQQTNITAQSSVEEAEIRLKTEQVNLEKLLKQNAAKRRQAEETLKAAKLNLDLSIASSETSLENSIRDTQTTVLDALIAADELLEFSIEQRDLDYINETHIGVRDPVQKVRAIEELDQAYQALDAFQPTYQNALTLSQRTEEVLRMVSTTLSNSTTSTQYTQADLNSDISGINTNLDSIQALVSELKSAKATLDSTAKTVSAGQSQTIVDAEVAYETTIAELDAAEQTAYLSVEQAEKALASAKANAEASKIGARSSLTTAAGELDQARVDQTKLVIEAPFDGYVSELSHRVGREIPAGELIVSVENPDLLKVVTFVSADEVQRVNVGDIVTINNNEQARISSVARSADPISKKFRVEMTLRDQALQPGAFVTITYETVANNIRSNTLFVPVTAVHVSAADTFVWNIVASGSSFTVQKQQVTLGEISGKFVEIRSGIRAGDVVVIDGGRTISDTGTEVEIANLEQLERQMNAAEEEPAREADSTTASEQWCLPVRSK